MPTLRKIPKRLRLHNNSQLKKGTSQIFASTLKSCRKIYSNALSSCRSSSAISSKHVPTRSSSVNSTSSCTNLNLTRSNPCNCTAWASCSRRRRRTWRSRFKQRWCFRWRLRTWRGRLILLQSSLVGAVEISLARQSTRVWSTRWSITSWPTKWWFRRLRSDSQVEIIN